MGSGERWAMFDWYAPELDLIDEYEFIVQPSRRAIGRHYSRGYPGASERFSARTIPMWKSMKVCAFLTAALLTLGCGDSQEPNECDAELEGQNAELSLGAVPECGA